MSQLVHFDNPTCAANWCIEQRKLDRTIGFVPTMGALHEGHLSLIQRAQAENDVNCVSIFVNPLQFNESNDYDRYPRNLEDDLRKLRDTECSMVFTATNRDMFPEASSIDEVQLLDPGIYAVGLEGEYRPGHLEGVCTVVERLFRFVGHCRAYFGLKDYQQLLVIEDLASRLGFPQIRKCRTIRDRQGLAQSSRNALLSEQDRQVAHSIFRALNVARELWRTGVRQADEFEVAMRQNLDASLDIDYAEVRDPSDWLNPSVSKTTQHAIALIAARIGKVRLIDNLQLDAD